MAFSTMQVQRAGDALYVRLVDVVERGRVFVLYRLAPERGVGYGVRLWVQGAVERDMFGDATCDRVHERIVDLVTQRVVEYRGAEDAASSPRSAYVLRDVRTQVPIDLFVARTQEEWEAFEPPTD